MPQQMRYETLVGAVIGAHGIQGAVKVKLATPTALSLIAPPSRASELEPKPFVEAWLGASPDEGKVCRIYSAKRQEPKELCLVKLGQVNTRSAAEEIVGLKLFAPDDRRAPLEADEFFVNDLIGLEVVTEGDVALGKVADVLSQPGNDVYETDSGALIPAVKEFVVSVDLQARRIVVRDVPGLVPAEQEAVEPGQEDDAAGEPGGEATGDANVPALARIRRRRFGAKR